jgi:hypothetical protein
MEISDTWAPLLLSAVRDAVVFNDNRLQSETLRDRADCEEHALQLHIFLDYLKDEYRAIEAKIGLPLEKIIPEVGWESNAMPIGVPTAD